MTGARWRIVVKVGAALIYLLGELWDAFDSWRTSA